jgi:hypothetical protein
VKKNDFEAQERNDYPANYSEISEFSKWKDLKVVQSEEVSFRSAPSLAGARPGH